MVTMSPGAKVIPLPGSPPEEVSSKSFDIRKYRTAATTILRSKRPQEAKQINARVTAYKLPFEILSKIFVACARKSVDDPTWSWVGLSFVCSTWRRAALECQELWSYIDFSHPKWTSITLHRARTLPISVRAIVDANNQRSLLCALQSTPTIRDVHITSPIHRIAPLMEILKRPNPFLESLIIHITKPDNNNDIRFSKRAFQSAGPPLPKLRYLELHRCPFGLVSPQYIGLTHLSLHHLPFSERPSRQEFLSLIEKFLMLEHLTLIHAFPKNIVAGQTISGRIVQLPNLHTLSLTGSVQELVNLLDCIMLPPTARLQCYIDRVEDFKTNFWRLAKAIGSHFREAVRAIPIDTLVVSVREDSSRFLNDYETNPDFRQTLRVQAFGVDPRCTDAVLDLTLGPDSHTANDNVIVNALSAIWDALPLMQVHTLTLQSVDVITQKSWPRLLLSLPSLRVIDIVGHAPSGLVWALLLNARSHSHLEYDDTNMILLPRLNDIYLHNIDCFAGGLMVSQLDPINSHSDLDDSRFLDVLLAYLEDRHRCGFGVRSLCLSRCVRVAREVMEELRGCVSNLWWDNHGCDEGEGLDSESPATYRGLWSSKPPVRRHFHRLKTLLHME
ncbi:hypothetical protein BDZ94DRAFT_1211513 [Collybia nuda]|uniref:F-box domain-containing protein n=1 Tax=Collybia nuda TaxID=64659 RepID=A0A9P6CNM9_9AGAR|nr:hypothetical protein BDZ94DRAFT_1211513 [Collybia nuda]